MESLGTELQRTIRNLERIRDAVQPRSEGVVNTLDHLYQQQIELIDAAIQRTTDDYRRAYVAMKDAAHHTNEAIVDLAKLEKTLERVGKATKQVGKLLSAVV
jgi:ABC-type transporter Mla subunit MlaD